jgi:hypothetical protein
MRRRARKVAFRVVEIFDYRTLMVASVLTALLLVGYLVVGAVQSAHDANITSNQRSKAASRRIDGLQHTIARQGEEIADLRARQAASAARQEALAHQVQQLGGEPVVSPEAAPRLSPALSATPKPRSSSSPRPRPSTSPTRSPTPRPSPSPTCLPLPIIGCR